MSPIVRNISAVVAGVAVGSLVNMGLINLGPFVVPLPEGADSSTMENLRESMRLYTPLNFLFPFLAHALGTLSGAFAAAKIAASGHLVFAMGIGVYFLVVGVMMVKILGGPVWFSIADLLLAFIPMGYLGGVLARRK